MLQSFHLFFISAQPFKLQLYGTGATQALSLWLGGQNLPTAQPRAWMLTLSHAIWPESNASLCTVHGLSCEGF